MNLFLTGLNHKTAPISVREKVAFHPENLPRAFRVFREFSEIRETLILSTCNRTEIYAVSQTPILNGLIPECLARVHDISPRVFKNHLYVKEGIDVARHLFDVASGLDSLVLGEDQILGQVKQHFRWAQDAKSLGIILHRLFQSALQAGKKIRRETSLGENPSSIGEAAVLLAEQIFGSLEGRGVLVVGTGEMGKLVLETLAATGVSSPMVVTRNREKMEEFAREVNGTAYRLEEIDQPLLKADIVIAASGSSVPLVTRAKLESILRQRRRAPLFVVDIGVPRNVEESAGRLENLFLYNIDDLRQIVEEANDALQKEVAKARGILALELEKFSAWLESLQVTPTLCALQDKLDHIKDKEVRRVLAKCPDLNERQRAAFENLGHSLLRKFIHEPLVRLKSHDNHPLSTDYVGIVRDLFGLENPHE